MARFAAAALTVFTLLLSACGGGYSGGSSTTPPTTAASTPSPAQPEVSVLPTLLTMPELNRTRQVRLYLPPGYATSGKRYPVLYMHDGQNLFESATGDEWHVDETLNELAKSSQLELIVVGIDAGEKRWTEYNPYDSAQYGAGEGRQYVDFIVNVVKPYIDKNYRTMPEREKTGVMGSSMGGLISHYAINRYPNVFSKAGVFSPSYWNCAPMYDLSAATHLPQDARLYLQIGQLEGSMVQDTQRMGNVLRTAGVPEQNLIVRITPGGLHSNAFWSVEFRTAVLWLFAP